MADNDAELDSETRSEGSGYGETSSSGTHSSRKRPRNCVPAVGSLPGVTMAVFQPIYVLPTPHNHYDYCPRPVQYWEGAPPILLETLRSTKRLGVELLLRQVSNSYTACNINLSDFRTNVTHVLMEALQIMFEGRENRLRQGEMKEILASCRMVLPDIIGRCLYMRLYAVNRFFSLNQAAFDHRPPFSYFGLEVPMPVARLINSIGYFRPVGVETDVQYIPTLANYPDNDGGTLIRNQFGRYQAIVRELSRLNIPMSRIDTKNLQGTGWWLLEAEHDARESLFDIIPRFPVQAGNISDTDAINFSYTVSDGHNHISRLTDTQRGSHFGTLLRMVNYSEPTMFMISDLDRYLAGDIVNYFV